MSPDDPRLHEYYRSFDCFEALCHTVGLKDGGFVLVMRSYRGYFDSSGGVDRPSVVIAGFVATLERWKELWGKWDELKKKYDIKHFHSVECEHGQGEFDKKQKPRWADPKARSDCRMDFVSAITEVGLPGLVVGVVMEDYERLSAAERKRLGKPFAFLAQALGVHAKNWANRAGVYERIPYLFEAGSDGYGMYADVFNQVIANPIRRDMYRMESVALVGKECNGAQAADLLAYESSHCMNSKIAGNRKGFQRPAITQLRSRLDISGRYFHEKQLREILSQPKS